MNQIVNKKRIVVNTFFLYAKTLITMVIAFVSTRIILDGLGEMDFGIYGTVGGAIVMLESLNLAMSQATQRFANYAEGKGDKEQLISIFNNTIILHLFLGLIIVILLAIMYYPLFNGVFTIPADRIDAAKYIYFFLVISTFFTIITVPYDALINAHEHFLYYSIVGIVTALLKLGAAFFVLGYSNDRLVFYGLLMAVIALFNMIVMRVFCKLKYEECHFEPRKYTDLNTIKEIGSFAGWNFVGAMSNMAGNHGSNILMNHFFGPVMIAAKNIGDQICAQVAILTKNMTKALNPVIVKSEGSGDRRMMLNLSFKSSRFGFLLYLVLAVPFIFNAEPLLSMWLKHIPEWAVLFCQLQVIRTLCEQLFTPLQTALIAQGTIKETNIADLIFSILTFLILWFLYRIGFSAQWHYYVSIAIYVILTGIVRVQLCKKICGMHLGDYLKTVVFPCSVVSVVAVAITMLLKWALPEWHVLIIVSVQVIALFVIETLFGITRSERQMVLEKVLNNVGKHGH